MKRIQAVLVGTALAVVLTACDRQQAMTEQEQSTLNVLTTNLKTQCVGRYLIDVPADSAIFGTSEVNGVTIESQAMSLGDYRKAMEVRSAQLKNTESRFGHRFLYVDSDIEGIPESRYFMSLGNVNANSDTDRLIEAYRWERGYRIKMQVQASDARRSVTFKDDPDVRNDPAMTNAPEQSQRVIALLSSARGRPDDEIPTERGTCFQGGFLTGQQWDSEKLHANFVLLAHHDVSFNLETNTDVHGTTTLLQRSKDITATIDKDPQGYAIRKGDVALQGMNAEEWLLGGGTALSIPGFYFTLEANSLGKRDSKPVVMLDFRVGAPSLLTGDFPTIERASLDKDEAIDLWDAVSRTLRPRPRGF
ncbi:T6SS immunity protein Tli4 family protein [Trinickia sp. LjRoot230]|uniref:T6SS immunity protein Tli4 family protein n=1 Tax=Trinickia sp. LjRoot230 TaxID=3342288 RepID=UPI003ECE6B5B